MIRPPGKKPGIAIYLAVAQKTGIPKWNSGKWKHGPNPAVGPSCLILSQTHFSGKTTKKDTYGGVRDPKRSIACTCNKTDVGLSQHRGTPKASKAVLKNMCMFIPPSFDVSSLSFWLPKIKPSTPLKKTSHSHALTNTANNAQSRKIQIGPCLKRSWACLFGRAGGSVT